MNIKCNNQNTSFGTLVPAKPLIKAALGYPTFEEAKSLNLSIGVKYSGHIGFHKRAIKIANEICTKNENFNTLIKNLKKIPKDTRENEINNIISQLGEQLDVLI